MRSKSLQNLHNDLPDLLICLHESQHETLLDQLEAARERNLRVELELELDRSDSTQPLLFTAQAANLPGEPGMSVCGFSREAPEPKSGDSSAALLEEALRANVELANFASIASHATSHDHELSRPAAGALTGESRRSRAKIHRLRLRRSGAYAASD